MDTASSKVLQALLGDTLPIGIFATGEADKSLLIPLVMLPTGKNYTPCVSESAEKMQRSLGVPKKIDVEMECKFDVLLKLAKLRRKLSEFRDIVNEYNNDLLLLLGQEKQRASNPKGIDDIVKRKVEWTFETTESFQNDVEHIIRHYLALFELGYLQLPQRYNAAREAEQLAKDMFQRINFWKMIDQVPEREEGFSRLIRKVKISKDVRTSPTFPAPKYVLPLGKLCRQKDADSPWTCLDKIVLMDITSPQKALWEFSSFGSGLAP